MTIRLSQQPGQPDEAGENGLARRYRSPISPKTLAKLRRALREAALALNLPKQTEVSVLLAGDGFVQDLNRRYRAIDKPTDVLSFGQDDPALLGDIVISVDTARRQASGARWPLSSELALLAAHGLLHLAGYDDQTEAGAREMERLTRRVLESSGVGLPREEHPFFQDI